MGDPEFEHSLNVMVQAFMSEAYRKFEKGEYVTLVTVYTDDADGPSSSWALPVPQRVQTIQQTLAPIKEQIRGQGYTGIVVAQCLVSPQSLPGGDLDDLSNQWEAAKENPFSPEAARIEDNLVALALLLQKDGVRRAALRPFERLPTMDGTEILKPKEKDDIVVEDDENLDMAFSDMFVELEKVLDGAP